MKNPGNFKAHLVLRPGVYKVQQQRIFNNSFLIMDKMDNYVIRQAFSLQPSVIKKNMLYVLLSSCIKRTV